MTPEWNLLLDTMIRWIPYIAMIIFIPIAVLLGRCMSKRACRNGPIVRSASCTDEEFWMGYDGKVLDYKKQQLKTKLKLDSYPISISTNTNVNHHHQSLPNIHDNSNSSDIFKSVSLTRETSGLVSKGVDDLNQLELNAPIVRGICSLCSTVYTENTVVKDLPYTCSHGNFHQKCAEEWFNKRGYCPQCIRPSSVSVIINE